MNGMHHDTESLRLESLRTEPGIASRAWYREPWPWLIVSIPAASIVLGVVMFALAGRTNDGLVADDYYKQGLGINRVLGREARARELGLRASLSFNAERSVVRLVLQGSSAPPATVMLRLAHPTRAGEDQTVMLTNLGGGMYEGSLAPPVRGRWHVMLEDASGQWRLAGVWRSDEPNVMLSAARE